MKEFIDKMANNDYVLIALIALLIILVIAFFIVLLCSGKKKNTIKEVKKDENLNNGPELIQDPNVDFNHEEYVKETTAEFELSPIADIKPINEEIIPIIQEESPSRKVENIRPVDENMMNTFSFDELSRMISDELNKTEEQSTPEVKTDSEEKNVASDNSFPFSTFKPIDVEEKTGFDEASIKTPEVSSIDDIFAQAPVTVSDTAFKEEVKSEVTEVKKPTDISDSLRAKFSNNFGSLFMNSMMKSDEDLELPKPAESVQEPIVKEVENANLEPVIKEEDVPLFARFNQETYDLNKKD